MKVNFVSTWKVILLFVLFFQLCSCAHFYTPEGAKLQVTTEFTGTTFTNGSRATTHTQYLNKAGEDRVRFNGRNLVNAVADNEKALKHARIYKATRPLTYIAFLTSFAGLTYGILAKESNEKLASTAMKVGLISFPTSILTSIFSSQHAKKAIKVYNGF